MPSHRLYVLLGVGGIIGVPCRARLALEWCQVYQEGFRGAILSLSSDYPSLTWGLMQLRGLTLREGGAAAMGFELPAVKG